MVMSKPIHINNQQEFNNFIKNCIDGKYSKEEKQIKAVSNYVYPEIIDDKD
jgi:hypothetical protein